MGTTKTQIQGGGGRLAYVLMIGGYPKLLTTWGNTSAVVTAYAATDWGTAVAGLEPPGEVTQSIVPFQPDMDSDGLTFVVKPDADDTFAKDVWASDKSGGAHARLTASVDNKDTTITVNSTADFASSGTAYIGTEAFTYTGTTATTFTTVTRGVYEPFGTEAAAYNFGRHHRINNIAGGQAGFPGATDYPKVWIGRSVACYCHRVVDGVPDVLAQAELVFAGHIAAITDSESGATHIACEDLRDYVANSILLGEQWSAAPPEGAYLPSTEKITFIEHAINTSASPITSPFANSTTLTVGTGGWIDEGLNTAEEIINGISDFLQDAKFISTTLEGYWTLTTIAGHRAKFTVQYTTTSTDVWSVNITIKVTDGIAGMLGLAIEGTDRSSDAGHPLLYKASEVGDDPIVGIAGAFPIAYSMLAQAQETTITISEVTGSFINQGSLIPQPWRSQYTTTTGTWGFIEIRDYLYLAKQVTATTFTIYLDEDILRALQREHPGARPASDNFYGVGLYDDLYIRLDEPVPRFKQIIIAHEPNFGDWLKKTFYSTGTTDYNETSNSLDKYDRQLGVGIPYQLLGSAFETSCTELANRSADQGITVIIDKPTKLVEFLLPELLLRNAHLILKDAGLAWIIPGATTAGAALHGLTESGKADPEDVTQVMYDREFGPIT